MAQPIEIAVPGFSDEEAAAASAFSQRMHEIYIEEGRKLCLLRDGAAVLVRITNEMLPNHTKEEQHKFMLAVLDAITSAMDLNAKRPEGSA